MYALNPREKDGVEKAVILHAVSPLLRWRTILLNS